MKNNEEEKKVKQNNKNQEELVEQTTETKMEEESSCEEIVKLENETELENIVEIEQTENMAETTNVEDIIQEIVEENTSKTKSINFWLLFVPIILVILLLIYIFTDLLKTDEQNFAKYMYITSKKIEKLKSEELEKYFDKTKYTSDGEISLTTDGEEAKVQFNGKTDVENRLKETNITTDYGTEELEIKYKQDNDIYAIKIDELYNKYIAIENNNLKELANSFGLKSEKIPNKIELEKCKFTEDELVNIKQKYTKIIKNEISKDNYSKGKSDQYNIYKLSLTNEELNNIKIKVLEELKNDNLILEKYVILEEMNGNKIEKENLQKEIDLKIKELEDNISEQDKEALVISLYTKLNRCEKIEIKLSTETIVVKINENNLKVIRGQDNNKFSFEIQKEELIEELRYIIKIEEQSYNLEISLKYSDLSKDDVKEEYKVDLNLDNDKMYFNFINKTIQDDKLVINRLQGSECEILNNLNKNQINELIYKIYCNMIDL